MSIKLHLTYNEDNGSLYLQSLTPQATRINTHKQNTLRLRAIHPYFTSEPNWKCVGKRNMFPVSHSNDQGRIDRFA